MGIDLKRLRADVKRHKAARTASPIGQIKTGATDIVRKNLRELERMNREDGALWTEIAAGLAAQGVTEGKGRPISGRRVNKLISNIKVQAAKMKNKEIARSLPKPAPDPVRKSSRPVKKTVTLAPEMKRQQRRIIDDRVVSEEKIRLAALQKHAHLLKKR
jgi:hypothetical protein